MAEEVPAKPPKMPTEEVVVSWLEREVGHHGTVTFAWCEKCQDDHPVKLNYKNLAHAFLHYFELMWPFDMYEEEETS